MSISRVCPSCRRWHDASLPCSLGALRPTPASLSVSQTLADITENQAIDRFRQRRRPTGA